MTSMPRIEQISGIQSRKVTWNSDPFLMDLEKEAASITKKTLSANWTLLVERDGEMEDRRWRLMRRR